ncbi:MAG: low temperature requirement protein A [Mycoplasmatales bacterium]
MEKRDIRWEELFYDIIFVVGVGTIILKLEHELNHISLHTLLLSISMFLIIFNSWIRIVMLENKIKIVERKTNQEITPYSTALFTKFLFIIFIIYSYYISDYYMFIYVYTAVTIINVILFSAPKTKIVGLLFLSLLTFFNFDAIVYSSIVFIFVLVDTIFNYLNLKKNTNTILESDKKVTIAQYIEHKEDFDLEKLKEKIYVPHIIQRLGIVMIIFMAEFVVGLPDVMKSSDTPLMSGFVLLFILFYYFKIYFSIIDHYDVELWKIEDKSIRYQKAKKTIYVSVLFYVCIMMLIIISKSVSQETNDAYGIYCLIGIYSFVIANHLQMSFFDNVIKKYKVLYYAIQSFILLFTLILVKININELYVIWYLFVFIITLHLFSRITTIKFKI